jgi:hypothetical protein
MNKFGRGIFVNSLIGAIAQLRHNCDQEITEPLRFVKIF